MSLDITLITKEPITEESSGIFIRENGATIEISAKEWNKRNPDRQIEEEIQTFDTYEAFSTNITHNLGRMASEAGFYDAIWRPYRLNPDYNIEKGDYDAEYEFESKLEIKAKDIISNIEEGLIELKNNTKHYKMFSSKNGWGTYEQFVPFVEEYLKALKEYPEAEVRCDR